MNPTLQYRQFRTALLCCGAVLLMLLSACGQSGPLFLPEDSSAEPAPAEQAADDGEPPEDEDGEGDGR